MTDEERLEEYLKINEREVNGVYDSEEKLTEAESYYEGYNEGLKQAYLDGLAEGRKEEQEKTCYCEHIQHFEKEVAELEKENAELKKDKEYLNKVNDEQTKVILKLNEQIKLIESVTAANADLIQKMKCCRNEMLLKLSL